MELSRWSCNISQLRCQNGLFAAGSCYSLLLLPFMFRVMYAPWAVKLLRLLFFTLTLANVYQFK